MQPEGRDVMEVAYVYLCLLRIQYVPLGSVAPLFVWSASGGTKQADSSHIVFFPRRLQSYSHTLWHLQKKTALNVHKNS